MSQLIPDELATAVAERQAILFAGAGLSMSVGLPSWQELVTHMSGELGLTADEAPDPLNNFHSLAEYYRIEQGSIGPLRSWMDRNWKVSEEKVRASQMHRIIVNLDFPLIYTTNYDRNVEVAFDAHGRDYVKVANARDIAKTREGVAQIVKFHGDFEDDDSLVITETDYFNRLAFDTPLDIKFRSDALGKTVLFIGYSMSDLNIRLLLHNLWRTWSESGYEKDRPRSFVFMTRRNPMQAGILKQWGITVLTGGSDEPEQALTDFLSALQEEVSKIGTAESVRTAAE
jgi:hypothetical protein